MSIRLGVVVVIGTMFLVLGAYGVALSGLWGVILMSTGIIMIMAAPSLSQSREEVPGSWVCEKCMVTNLADDQVCYSCGRKPLKTIQ